MANELQAFLPTGKTLYAVLLNAIGQVWDGSQFEAIASGTWTDNDIALTEATAGIYLANMPAVGAGSYSYLVYEQAGASPAVTDALVGMGSIDWNGIAVLPLSALALEATLAANSGKIDAVDAKVSAIDTDTVMSFMIDGFTFEQIVQIMASVLAGKLTRSGDTLTFRDLADMVNRVVAETDANKQRTTMTYTV